MQTETVPVHRSSVFYGDLPVRVVVVRDTLGTLTAFVAQGLERDIAAQGSTIEQALSRLAACAKADHELDGIRSDPLGPAPLHVHEWYRQAPEAEGGAAGRTQS